MSLLQSEAFSRDRHGFHSAANTQVFNETCQVQGAQPFCLPHGTTLFPLSLAWTVRLCFIKFDWKDLQIVKLHFAIHLKEKSLCLGSLRVQLHWTYCRSFQTQTCCLCIFPLFCLPTVLFYGAKAFSFYDKPFCINSTHSASFDELHTFLGVFFFLFDHMIVF